MWLRRPNLDCSLSLARTELISMRELRTKQVLVTVNTTIDSGAFIEKISAISHNRVKMLLVKLFVYCRMKPKNPKMNSTSISWCHELLETTWLSAAAVPQQLILIPLCSSGTSCHGEKPSCVRLTLTWLASFQSNRPLHLQSLRLPICSSCIIYDEVVC